MRRVLFIDDDPAVLAGLRRMLRSKRDEWDLTFADGGQGALETLARETFDVVITDMRMPGIDGADVLARLRVEHPGTVRIVLSGHTEQSAALRSASLAHRFLSKPCDPQRLIEAIDQACRLEERLRNPELRRLVGQMTALPSPGQVVLDLNAGSGLLTWEALRRAPEGQVWALTRSLRDAEAISQTAGTLPELQRPIVAVGRPGDRMASLSVAAKGQPPAFDVVLGRDVLTVGQADSLFAEVSGLLASGGRVVLAGVVRSAAQRLHRLVDLGDDALRRKVGNAEESIYEDEDRPEEVLAAAAESAGLTAVKVDRRTFTSKETLPRSTVEAWFDRGSERPSYSDLLGRHLSERELASVRASFLAQLPDTEVTWHATYLFVTARRP